MRAGVQGTVKNIIFAAKYKPEIVFDDALNNDIRITRNADKCLIYDRPIPQNDLLWSELVEWFATKNDVVDNVENRLLRRLCDSLDDSFKADGAKSGPETWMMQAYYELMKACGKDFPALLPQVYLYYDPLTQAERGYKLFEHQKMDFLMIFSHRNRVVIEIDGKQHYHYCYLLGRIEKRQYPPRMTPHLRQEIMKAETYKARLKFLQENNITTADDLNACIQQAENDVTQLAKQRTILNVRKKKRKKLFDALATEEALAMSKALYEEGLSGMEAEYAQYAEAKAVLDACGISRQALTEEKADIYGQLAQLNKQIRAERQKIKLCREIADSAAVMQRDVTAQEKSLHEKETEHSFTNRR